MFPKLKSYCGILSLLLSFSLIFNLVGISIVSAAPEEAQLTPQKNKIAADIGELPDKLPKTKLELINKRTKYSTRYVNPDGSFTEEIYLEPRFYQDPSDKKWNPSIIN